MHDRRHTAPQRKQKNWKSYHSWSRHHQMATTKNRIRNSIRIPTLHKPRSIRRTILPRQRPHRSSRSPPSRRSLRKNCRMVRRTIHDRKPSINNLNILEKTRLHLPTNRLRRLPRQPRRRSLLQTHLPLDRKRLHHARNQICRTNQQKQTQQPTTKRRQSRKKIGHAQRIRQSNPPSQQKVTQPQQKTGQTPIATKTPP